jgi:hypothetical protein
MPCDLPERRFKEVLIIHCFSRTISKIDTHYEVLVIKMDARKMINPKVTFDRRM